MRTHILKTWPEPFAAMADGRKKFEYRRDDRGFAVGDILELWEWDPAPFCRFQNDPPVGLTDRHLVFNVTYILRGFGVPDGFVVMGLGVAP